MYDKYMCILYAWITLINLLEEKHEYYGSCKINLGQLVSTDKMNCIQFGFVWMHISSQTMSRVSFYRESNIVKFKM